jgi:nicotinamidase-related amidase
MKTELFCYLEDRDAKRVPDTMDSWFDPDRTAIVCIDLPPNPSMDQHSWEGTKWLDLMVEVDERDLFVRTKKRLSSFYPTDLEFLLQNLDVDNVVQASTTSDPASVLARRRSPPARW